MMAGDRLVITRRGELVARLRLHVGEVDVEDARLRPVLRRVAVIPLGRHLLPPPPDSTHLPRPLRPLSEQLAFTRSALAPQPISLRHLSHTARFVFGIP